MFILIFVDKTSCCSMANLNISLRLNLNISLVEYPVSLSSPPK